MRGDISLVLDLIVKSSVLIIVCLVGVSLLRKSSAAMRHLLLVSCMAGLLALPLLEIGLPRWQVPFFWVQRLAPPPVDKSTSVESSTPAAQTPAPSVPAMPWWAIAWAIGSFCLVARTAVGLQTISKEQRRRPAMPSGALRGQIESMIGGRQVQILLGEPGQPPMTWGWRHPVLMLPETADTWPEDRLRSVVLHELAHIERADWLTHTIGRALCALYWFHPGVWLIARSMASESEHAADDRVLTLGCQPEDYAEHLVEVARAVRSGRATLTVAMARKAPIRERLNAVLASGMDRRPLTKPAAIGLFSVAAALAATVAAAGPRVIVASLVEPVESATPAPPTPKPSPVTVSAHSKKSRETLVRVAHHSIAKAATQDKVLSLKTAVYQTTKTSKPGPKKGQVSADLMTMSQGAVTSPKPSGTRGAPLEAEAGLDVAREVSEAMAESKGDVDKASNEVSKALEEAAREVAAATKEAQLETGGKSVKVNIPAIRQEVPGFRVDTPAISVNTGNLHLNVPPIHVRVPAVHIHVPKMQIDVPMSPTKREHRN